MSYERKWPVLGPVGGVFREGMAVSASEQSRLYFRFAWPATLAAPGAARRAVDVLPLAVNRGSIDDLRLLIDEVVTNAVIHSGRAGDDTIEMLVQMTPGSVRVEVTDSGTGFVPEPRNEPRVGRGLGMVLVDGLARAWGTISTPRFGVWFELPGGYRKRAEAIAGDRSARRGLDRPDRLAG